jgi:hypothetical protein
MTAGAHHMTPKERNTIEHEARESVDATLAETDDMAVVELAQRFAPETVAATTFDRPEKRTPPFEFVSGGEITGEFPRAKKSASSKPAILNALTDAINDALTPPTVGVKIDQGKAPVWQGVMKNFPHALLQVAHVSLYGSTKYPSYQDWHLVVNGDVRYAEALGRHWLQVAAGEQFDGESNLLHLAHVAWNALAVLELELRKTFPAS